MHISILEAKFARKKCALYTGKYGMHALAGSVYPGNFRNIFNVTKPVFMPAGMGIWHQDVPPGSGIWT